MSAFTYIKTLLRDPSVASVAPTSAQGVERILRDIDFSTPKVIVEYGPGGGVITEALLEKLSADSVLIAIERNENFVELLRKEIRDPRLKLFHGSAEDVLDYLKQAGVTRADHVISGIPFSMFPEDLKDRIISRTGLALGSRGSFIVYQFLLSLSGPKTDIKRKLSQHLELFRAEVEFKNIPPLRLYEARTRA